MRISCQRQRAMLQSMGLMKKAKIVYNLTNRRDKATATDDGYYIDNLSITPYPAYPLECDISKWGKLELRAAP